MPDDRSQAAVRATAQMIADDDVHAIAAGFDSIPSDELIAEPNPADYVCPHYLKKTAPQLALAFSELLKTLLEFNALFVGERTVEVQAMLSLTGDHEWLEEKFLGWCQMYFKIRGNLDRLSPQNGNDPWRLYQACFEEFNRLLEKRIVQPGTINSSVLNLSQRFMVSGFAMQVMGPDLTSYVTTGRDRFSSEANRLNAVRLVEGYRQEVKAFTAFLELLTKQLPAEYAPNDDPGWLTSIEAKVAERAEDISFLRTVLCVLNINNADYWRITNELWARLTWDVYHGGSVAVVLTSSSPIPSTERATLHQLAFRRDGWLCHREFPWLRVQPDYLPAARRAEYAANWHLLDTLTSPLYEAWDRLEPGSVISRGLEADATEEEQTAALAVAFVESGTALAETPVAKRPRLPQLRLKRIRMILMKHFGCEWSMAKGSEQKVFRQGAKQFTFGCHGTDRAVDPVQLKSCLMKLGIPLADFVEVCRY